MKNDTIQSYDRRYYTIARWVSDNELYVSELRTQHFQKESEAQSLATDFYENTDDEYFVVLVTDARVVIER